MAALADGRRPPSGAGESPVSGPALTALADADGRRIDDQLHRRTAANLHFFSAEAAPIAALCHQMAERFARGGRLIALGATPADRSDARHVAVEFVHPVIVGKRALPALALGPEGGALAVQVDLLARTEDVVISFGSDADAVADGVRAVAVARARGCLTLGFRAGMKAEWLFDPSADDPMVRQELIETLYHVLWELVHVFFEHRGLLAGRTPRPVHDAGASAFLYPFLAESEVALGPVLEDVRRSVVMKARETGALRERTLRENGRVLADAAADLRRCLSGGGTVFTLGNGGSATDAMDLAADLRAAGHPAVDLTEDTAIITAIANDIGTEAIFARQVIAHGHRGDALIALSTSGSSANVISALAEARRRDLVSVALVGYDGGRIVSERLADRVIVTPSEYIPRIQEAQASAYHVLCELVG